MKQYKLKLASIRTGTVDRLAAKFRKELYKLSGNGTYGEGVEIPWCREEEVPCGTVTFFSESATHLVKKGAVWKITDPLPQEFCSTYYAEEIVGITPKITEEDKNKYNLALSHEIFYKMANIKRCVEEAKWALAGAGCKWVYVVWRQAPTLLSTEGGEGVVFAEVCIYGSNKEE